MKDLASYVHEIPDFPKKGVLFRDITGILDDVEALRFSVDELMRRLDGVEFDVLAAMESRGFIFGMPLAYLLGKPFLPVRKPGKLPRATIAESYELEYGESRLEIHTNLLHEGCRVVVVDDLLATGGTAAACAHLIARAGAKVVKMLFIMELAAFGARKGKLDGIDVDALITYPEA